jgi:hypothetical protein
MKPREMRSSADQRDGSRALGQTVELDWTAGGDAIVGDVTEPLYNA